MTQTIQVQMDGEGAGTNAAIQRAVDTAVNGGVVEIPDGEYLMHNALHLRSGVCVVGEAGTVLKKTPSVSSRIIDYLGYGHYELTVNDPALFRVGMGIHVIDDHAAGFYTTVATIVGIAGERLLLDRPLNHDYSPAANARAISVFPLVEADNITGASIENLCIDGNKDQETFELNGCRGGGIFIYQSRRITARNVEVRNYRGDAISFQQNIDVTIDLCHIHHNTGGGMHPGSGSVRYLLKDNRIHDNGGNGIFYCLRTTHSICRDNLIENNRLAGISIGERDTDHLVAGNTIRGQGGPGVSFRLPARRSGDRVHLQANTLGGNCRNEGAAEIEIAPGLRQIHVTGNTIAPVKVPAISVGDGCAEIYIHDNLIAGRPQHDEDVAGRRDLVQFMPPNQFPPLGPSALPADGARHLNVDHPGPCEL